METHKYCVYNQTRESFLSLGVAVVDSARQAVESADGEPVCESGQRSLAHAFQRDSGTQGLTPIDLIYLDDDNRVIQVVESFPNTASNPCELQPTSALVCRDSYNILIANSAGRPACSSASPRKWNAALTDLPREPTLAPFFSARRIPIACHESGRDREDSTGSPTVDRAMEMQIAHQRLRGEGKRRTGGIAERIDGSFGFCAGFPPTVAEPNGILFLGWLHITGRAELRRRFILAISARMACICSPMSAGIPAR